MILYEPNNSVVSVFYQYIPPQIVRFWGLHSKGGNTWCAPAARYPTIFKFFFQFYPMWLAPNLLTLLGFGFVMFSFFVISYFDYYMQANSSVLTEGNWNFPSNFRSHAEIFEKFRYYNIAWLFGSICSEEFQEQFQIGSGCYVRFVRFWGIYWMVRMVSKLVARELLDRPVNSVRLSAMRSFCLHEMPSNYRLLFITFKVTSNSLVFLKRISPFVSSQTIQFREWGSVSGLENLPEVTVVFKFCFKKPFKFINLLERSLKLFV